MRIRPFEFRYLAFQLHRLVGVVLRGEGVVRNSRNRYGQKNNRRNQDSDLVFHRASIF